MSEETNVAPKADGWKQALLKQWRKTPTVLKAAATLVIALKAFYQLYTHVFFSPSNVTHEDRVSGSSSGVASKEKMAFPLPDKPSIAALPFTNMSGGLTEEIITAPGKVPRLFVIARSSTFTYKGKPVKVSAS